MSNIEENIFNGDVEKLKIFWHDLWLGKGPMFGVGEYQNQIVYYQKEEEDLYNLYRFKSQESIDKAFLFHREFVDKFGGHHEHIPEKFSPSKMLRHSGWMEMFDYRDHIEKEKFFTIEKRDILNFYPPTSY